MRHYLWKVVAYHNADTACLPYDSMYWTTSIRDLNVGKAIFERMFIGEFTISDDCFISLEKFVYYSASQASRGFNLRHAPLCFSECVCEIWNLPWVVQWRNIMRKPIHICKAIKYYKRCSQFVLATWEVQPSHPTMRKIICPTGGHKCIGGMTIIMTFKVVLFDSNCLRGRTGQNFPGRRQHF